MTTDAVERPGILNVPTTSEDQTAGVTGEELASEVLGLNTAALLKLAEEAQDSTLFPARFNKGLSLLPQLVSIVPLAERVQLNGVLATEDFAPYKKYIYESFPKRVIADKVATKMGKVAVNTLNRKVESKVVSTSNEMAAKAREVLKTVEADVELLTSFENPKEQFVAEINLLTNEVNAAIVAQRDMRVEGKAKEVYDGPGGIKGFFIKAIHKVKSIFSRIFGRSKNRQEITAYDAGLGIAKVVNAFRDSPKVITEKYPIIARFVPRILPKSKRFTAQHYALVAPEILGFLYSGSISNEENENILSSILRNSHDFRFLAKYKKSMVNIQNASRNLVPALIDVIPDTGSKVSEIFYRIQCVLGVKKNIEPSSDNENQPKNRSLLFKNIFIKAFNRLKTKRRKKQDD